MDEFQVQFDTPLVAILRIDSDGKSRAINNGGDSIEEQDGFDISDNATRKENPSDVMKVLFEQISDQIGQLNDRLQNQSSHLNSVATEFSRFAMESLVATDNEVIALLLDNSIRKSIAAWSEAKIVQIVVNPSWVIRVQKLVEPLLVDTQIPVVGDDALDEGDCIVEFVEQEIIWQLEHQLEQLKSSFLSQLETGRML